MNRSTFVCRDSEFINIYQVRRYLIGQSSSRRQIQFGTSRSKMTRKSSFKDILSFQLNCIYRFLTSATTMKANEKFRIFGATMAVFFLVSPATEIQFEAHIHPLPKPIDASNGKIERPKMRLVVACHRNRIKSETKKKNECCERQNSPKTFGRINWL